jgi:hypothetical protein
MIGSSDTLDTVLCTQSSLFVDSNPDTLKARKSELRLYCDLLMQQVHMVKTAVSQEGGPEVQVRSDLVVC